MGCKPAEDVVDKLLAVPRSCDDAAIGEPFSGLASHAGTIAAESMQSVMWITFPNLAYRMMRSCPAGLDPIVTTWS